MTGRDSQRRVFCRNYTPSLLLRGLFFKTPNSFEIVEEALLEKEATFVAMRYAANGKTFLGLLKKWPLMEDFVKEARR